MAKTVFILRHAESVKNTENTFSTADNLEALTLNGINQAKRIAICIDKYFCSHDISRKVVFSADSVRSMQTGSIIAETLNCNLVKTNSLCSFGFGTNAGKTEDEVEATQAKFYHDLSLYRKGIVNSYNIIYEGTNETLREFEYKVCKYVDDAINKCMDDTGIVIVMHRSALTAYIINIARKHLGYPDSFYGHIQLDLGNVCLIKLDDQELKYIDINIEPDVICRLD